MRHPNFGDGRVNDRRCPRTNLSRMKLNEGRHISSLLARSDDNHRDMAVLTKAERREADLVFVGDFQK